MGAFMKLWNKVFGTSVIALFLMLTVYVFLSNYEMNTNHFEGRVLHISRQYGMDIWKIVLYSSKGTIELSSRNKQLIKDLDAIGRKKIIVFYKEFFLDGLFVGKKRISGWRRIDKI